MRSDLPHTTTDRHQSIRDWLRTHVHNGPTNISEGEQVTDVAPRYVGATHGGRSWSGTDLEDSCPCPKMECGLVDPFDLHVSCEVHNGAKTFRQMHPADRCPGKKTEAPLLGGTTLPPRDEQPDPIHNDNPSAHDLAIAHMEQRKAWGVAKYGTTLQPFNGRDSLTDLIEELSDAYVYALNEKHERDELERKRAFERYRIWEEGYATALADVRDGVDGSPDKPYTDNPYVPEGGEQPETPRQAPPSVVRQSEQPLAKAGEPIEVGSGRQLARHDSRVWTIGWVSINHGLGIEDVPIITATDADGAELSLQIKDVTENTFAALIPDKYSERLPIYLSVQG